MNPYQQLMAMMASQGGAPAAPLAVSYPTVDEQIGQDKLAKHPYNPYGLLMPNAPAAPKVMSQDDNFIQEMTKDTRE